MNVASLQKVALALAESQTLDSVRQIIVRGLAEQSDVVESENTLELDSSASLEDVERQHIPQVLEKTGWLISGPNGAGAILKLHPNTLRSRMKRLGIRRPSHAIS
jgi:transcriptional regulator with GAF, ATPase, and Fis domain